MSVYYMVIVSMILLVAIDMKIKENGSAILADSKPHRLVVFVMISILALVAGLRYNVGTDYSNYYNSYNYFKVESLALNDEPGIKVIARIAKIIYDDQIGRASCRERV